MNFFPFKVFTLALVFTLSSGCQPANTKPSENDTPMSLLMEILEYRNIAEDLASEAVTHPNIDTLQASRDYSKVSAAGNALIETMAIATSPPI